MERGLATRVARATIAMVDSGRVAKTPGGWLGAVQPSPWWAGWRLSVVLVLLVISGSTLGYTLIEGWSPWDALYMTVISVTTVGYREVHPMSRRGELLTMLVLMVGVATADRAVNR